MAFKAAPLPHEWMIASIIGFFVSYFQIYSDMKLMKWGMAFMIFFILMFIASIISMTKATTDPADMEVLSAHHRRK